MFRKTECVCCTGRCGHRPLQTVCGFASVHPCLQVRTAGRTEASAPTGRCAGSPMVRAGLQMQSAGESAASTPTDTLRGRQSSCKFVGASCAGGASPALRKFVGLTQTWRQLKTYHPSPHPSAFGCHLPTRGRQWVQCKTPARDKHGRGFFLFFTSAPRRTDPRGSG